MRRKTFLLIFGCLIAMSVNVAKGQTSYTFDRTQNVYLGVGVDGEVEGVMASGWSFNYGQDSYNEFIFGIDVQQVNLGVNKSAPGALSSSIASITLNPDNQPKMNSIEAGVHSSNVFNEYAWSKFGIYANSDVVTSIDYEMDIAAVTPPGNSVSPFQGVDLEVEWSHFDEGYFSGGWGIYLNDSPFPYADVYIYNSGLYFDLGADGTMDEFVEGPGGVLQHTIPNTAIGPGGRIRLARPGGVDGFPSPGGFINFLESFGGNKSDIPTVDFRWDLLRSHGQ